MNSLISQTPGKSSLINQANCIKIFSFSSFVNVAALVLIINQFIHLFDILSIVLYVVMCTLAFRGH